ncbi:hypothetical protein QTP88_019512 [Uroleucon formosanum]
MGVDRRRVLIVSSIRCSACGWHCNYQVYIVLSAITKLALRLQKPRQFMIGPSDFFIVLSLTKDWAKLRRHPLILDTVQSFIIAVCIEISKSANTVSVSVLFVSLTTVNTVFKMEFVESKKDKRMLIFYGFKYVFGYTSQTNVTQWRCFMKNCPANILEKEKVILETKG